MRYPYERFLKFLLSRKVDLNAILKRYHLPAAGLNWITDERSRIRKTAPCTVGNYMDSDKPVVVFTDGFLEWADQEDIGELWRQEPEFFAQKNPDLEQALKIFSYPLRRGIVGLLFWVNTTDEERLVIIKERLSIKMTGSALNLYRKLFWDITFPKQEEWREFIGALVEEEKHYLGFGMEPVPDLEMTRYILGLITKVAPENVIENVMLKSNIRFNIAVEAPQPDEHCARNWGDLALNAAKALQSGTKRAGASDVKTPADLYSMFSVRVEKYPIPTLAELQGEISVPKIEQK